MFASIVIISVAVSGCGPASSNESCGQFSSQGTSAQKALVTKLMEAHGTPDPSPAAVDVAWLSAQGFCFTHATHEMLSGMYQG